MSAPETPETIVLQWVEAFNERDLDATLDAPAHPVLPAAPRRSPPSIAGTTGCGSGSRSRSVPIFSTASCSRRGTALVTGRSSRTAP